MSFQDYLVNIRIHLPKQDIVRNFLYTIRTQNIGVDLTIPMLSFAVNERGAV